METNLVYPALVASYTLLCARKYFRRTLPLFIPSIVFVIVHMIVAPKLSSGPYGVHIDRAIPVTLWTYWSRVFAPGTLAPTDIAGILAELDFTPADAELALLGRTFNLYRTFSWTAPDYNDATFQQQFKPC